MNKEELDRYVVLNCISGNIYLLMLLSNYGYGLEDYRVDKGIDTLLPIRHDGSTVNDLSPMFGELRPAIYN